MDARPIRAVFWDWNGTLLDDAHVCVAAINRLLAPRGLPLIDVAKYREWFVFPVIDYYRRLGFDIDHEDWDALAREFHAALREVDDSVLRPEAIPVLRKIKARGVPQHVLSLCEQSILERKVAACGARDCFGRLQGVDNLDGSSKRDVGRRLLADLALDPEDVMMIGDTLHDSEVAAALGCRCTLVSCGHQAPWRLAASGRAVVPMLDDALGLIAHLL